MGPHGGIGLEGGNRMRKAALIFMVFALCAAVLLPSTAQALLQPGLVVNVKDGHAQMDAVAGTAEYHFVVRVFNGWSRSMHVTCNFRVYQNDGAYTGHPGPANAIWFGDVGFSGRMHRGWTTVNMTATNNEWSGGTVSQWTVFKRGCYKGPNHNY